MKKLILSMVVIMAMGMNGCAKQQEVKVVPTTKVAVKKVVEAPKVYKQGEEATMYDNSGKAMYSIKINKVTVANDFIYKSDFNPDTCKEIVAVSYTYKNIAKVDENKLRIGNENLTISDSTGAVGVPSNAYQYEIPQSVPVGTSCTVLGHYALMNETNIIKVGFSSEAYSKNGQITFEIAVK